MATVRKRTRATRKDGSVPIVVNYTDQYGKRRQKTFPTVKAAENWKIETQKAVKDGTHTPDHGSITLLQAANRWVDHGEAQGIRPDVNFVRRNRIANHLAGTAIGRMKLSQLTTVIVDDFYDGLLRNGATRNLAADVMVIIKATLKYAQRRHLVAQNVATPIRIMREAYKRKQIDVDIPRQDEASAMVEHAPDRWRAFIVTALFTGMRPCELRALNWQDIDFPKRTITVLRSADSQGRIHLPKTQAGQRILPMLPQVYEVLKQQAQDALKPITYGHLGFRRVNEAMLARRYGRMPDKPIVTNHSVLFYQKHFDRLEELANNGEWDAVRAWTYPGSNKYGPKPKVPGTWTGGWVARLYKYKEDLLDAHNHTAGDNILDLTALKKDALVFPNYAGKVFHLCTLQEGMDATQTAASVTKPNLETGRDEPKYSLYALRHFFASWRIDCGDRPDQIKELMGHKSIKITYDTYGHLFPRTEEDYTRMATDAARLLATKTRQNATILDMPQRNQ